jgi:adenosine deaminase
MSGVEYTGAALLLSNRGRYGVDRPAGRNPGRVTQAEYIRRLPKVQLHCHLEGTVRAATFRELALRHGVDIGPRGSAPLDRTYEFATFNEFLRMFMDVCKTLCVPEDYARMARDYVEDAAAQGVAYAEVHISPPVWSHFHPDLDIRRTIEAMREALDDAGRAHDMRVAFVYDLVRNFGPERAVANALHAASLQDLGVVAAGLGGDEVAFPPALFTEAFATARAAGLHLVAHAGEAAGPESVRDALDLLGVERIDHGVRAIADDALVDELARREVALDMCPTSNRLTGAVLAGTPHPIAEFDRRGVRCNIDADDPPLFGTTLCDEYAAVAELTGSDALERFARNAIDASFAEPSHKARLRERLTAVGAETAPARRTP